MKVTLEQIKELNEKISQNDFNKVVINAVGRVNLNELAINRSLVKSFDFSFSNELDVDPEATAQQRVGVCWIFAAMNLLRYFTQKKINVKSFKFSGPYLMFWDKFEKANYFLEKMIEFKDRPYDDRDLGIFLKEPLPDGGDWYMFVNLVKKYGIIPESMMQHSQFSKDSDAHNRLIASKLRKYASEIRKMAKDGKSDSEIKTKREEFTEELYRIMVNCFGIPPMKFNWSYRDEDKKFFREKEITPHDFYEKYVGMDLDEYTCVWSSPMEDTPYNKLFSVAHTRKMVGGDKHLALNIPFDEMKSYAIKKIKNNDPILFSCDIPRDTLRKEGLLLKGIYNYDLLFQTSFEMNQAARLEMGESAMTHCMLIVGVDLDEEEKPIKWKVENSWGTDVGKKGYFIMSDEWFDDNVYQLIIPKKYLTEKELKILKDEKPTTLPLWHPMF